MTNTQQTRVADLKPGDTTPWYAVLAEPTTDAEGVRILVRYTDTGTEGFVRGWPDEEVPVEAHA